MTGESSTGFALQFEDSLRFARLSGDFNPLHVDPVAARRTQYGSTVTHGIHLLCNALERACASGQFSPARLDSIQVTFSGPVKTGVPVTLELRADGAARRLRISGGAQGRQAFSVAVVECDARADAPLVSDEPGAMAADPVVLDYPLPAGASPAGEVPLSLEHALARSMFPALCAADAGIALLAELLATTRIVGMECPGLHSIYSGFKLKRRSHVVDAARTRMRFSTQKVDPRFRLIRLALTGALLEGTLDAFFRPPPVAQRPLGEIAGLIEPRAFAGRRALVVGGSRGLGEIAAKVLLAGGAEVTVSYARGESDAARVSAEAAAFGGVCHCMQLDASQPLPEHVAARARGFRPTDIYYFASPHIDKSTSGDWDSALFDRFAAIYVRGLAGLTEALARADDGQAANIFYPSTVFLDQVEKGFAEYCCAKAAGETLCQHLATRFGVRVATPRLPRMRTDQTSGLTDAGAEDPVPVIVAALREFHR